MTLRDRFIKSIIATAQADDTQFPWTLSAARQKNVTRRSAVTGSPRRAKLASG